MHVKYKIQANKLSVFTISLSPADVKSIRKVIKQCRSRCVCKERQKHVKMEDYQMKDLHGKTAVLIGAASGIGKETALEFARQGVTKFAIADIDAEGANQTAEELKALGAEAFGMKVDVRKLEDVEALADAAYKKYGSVELLMNNAGVTLRPFRASWDTTYSEWEWMMGINFWGVLHGHMAFVKRMMETEGEKHIVNTSSMASLWDIAGHSSYSASKAAVDGLSNAAREELKFFNIGVSVLHPGAVRTRIATSARLMSDEDRARQDGVKCWSDYLPKDVSAHPTQINKVVVEGNDPDLPPTADYQLHISTKYVGQFVVEGILKNKPHITTHPLPMDKIQARFDGILGSVPDYSEIRK